MNAPSLLVELFVEELPPKALKKLGESFASTLFDQLQAAGLLSKDSAITPFASPRRLGAHITRVQAQAQDKPVQQKLMPVSVGLDASGQATPALIKKLAALGVAASEVASVVPQLQRQSDGKAETLYYDSMVKGASLATGLQTALDAALSRLPIPKVMSYQLETDCELPGWSSVHFVRPAHRLVALHGDQVVPIQTLGLKADRITHGHRFEAAVDPVVIRQADDYEAQLAQEGSVIAGFDQRRAEMVRQLHAAAARVGGGVRPIDDDALLDEVTALVERPNVLVCEFEKQFLDVPQECLILTMKANQKYFPLLDASGKLTHQFLVVSNISPADASAVIGGNERVVRPRLADAKFFFDQDRKKTLASRVPGLHQVVYHNKLGTQGERTERVRAMAKGIAALLPQGQEPAFIQAVDTAAKLAKADLLTDMVGEFPELQGIMGGYYARHDGLGNEVAAAIEDHYKPRFAGDELPRNTVGVVVALADKLETLVGMFGIGNLPTGDKDPFALRRHALGVMRMLIEKDLPLDLGTVVQLALKAIEDNLSQQARASAAAATWAKPVLEGLKADAVVESVQCFIFDRLAGSLRDQGYSAQEVDAVLALRPQRLSDVPNRLAAVRAFATLPEAAALAAANKRIGNILKKADEQATTLAQVNTALFHEEAERQLHATMQTLVPQASQQFQAGDYTASLQTLAALRGPVDAFFDDVMVNADDATVRRNRLSLLKALHEAMNRVADLSRLA